MKLVKDSPFNTQDPFQNFLASEFEIDTKNLLNSQAYANTIPEQTLASLPATDNNSAEDITSFSNSLSLSQSFPYTDFTPPAKNSALDALTGEIIGERDLDYSDKDILIGERRASQLAPTASNPKKPPIIQNAELKFTDSNNQPFPNNQPVLFITATNVLVDNFGDPVGSRFSDLTVKFLVGKQSYEATVLTDKSRKLANNQFEIAVQVPNTVPLGESRIVISRKQNEKVSPKPSEPAKEVKYDSTAYRIENNTEYIFAAQWTTDKVAIINGANPKSVVAATNSSDLSIASVSVGTDDILDRPRELTVTSDGSRAYVVMDRSGRIAVVDPMTRQQIDTQPNTAGINPINLPSGAEGRSIVIDPRDQYAYIADGKTGGNSIYVLDINPFSSKYHQVTQTITVGAAPSGLRQIALSSDGKKLFVTAPNGSNSKIYAVNIDPKDRPSDPNQNPKKWNQLIGNITADEGLEGLAATTDPLKMTFTNSGKDSKGFGVLDITNNGCISLLQISEKRAKMKK
ncbi:YncE family protein, partial [Microcoleus sp. herbarium19]|uniref:YncE family protein n=1 Tax=unclassified Microcoleus TaxID=2642155 RepID=UPI002FCF1134